MEPKVNFDDINATSKFNNDATEELTTDLGMM